MDIEEQVKEKMEAALRHLKQELKGLRTNRANPEMLEDVIVEVYGAPMRIKEVANITVVDFRQLLITPFDPQMVALIAKGIGKGNSNLQPVVEGYLIRVKISPMDQSLREEVVKKAKKKAEEAKVSIREIRRKSNEVIRKNKSDGALTEDLMKKLEKKIQELTDKSCKQADEIFLNKEKEILAV